MFFIWTLVFGCVFYFVEGQSCVYQGCFCEGNYTWCTGLGLTTIPPLVSTGIVTDLNFDSNSLTSLPSGSLPPNIQKLSLMSNPLTSIDGSAFINSLNTLKSVSLSDANFSTLSSAFGQLRKLKEFHLFNSRVSDWNQSVMLNLGATVSSLVLEECGIRLWPDWLRFFQNLTEISFAHNLISSIPDNGMDVLANTVISLDIQNNTLTSVPKAVSKMLALQKLFLQHNSIFEIKWLPAHSKLLVLAINNNFINDAEQLSQSLAPHADSLEQLNTESNSLISLPNLSFLSRVNVLSFSNNKLSDSISGSLPPNLYSVNLNSNNFRSIPKVLMTLREDTDLILNFNSLTELRDYEFPPWKVGGELSYNQITELTDTSFPANCSLQSLLLNNNPLIRISNQAFANVPRLGYLSLQSTKLSRLPLGLSSGRGLADVDLTGSDALVCTCEERELMTWVVTLPVYALLGTCGRTSIYEFYSNLASKCPH